jgi:hypothetical protein
MPRPKIGVHYIERRDLSVFGGVWLGLSTGLGECGVCVVSSIFSDIVHGRPSRSSDCQ